MDTSVQCLPERILFQSQSYSIETHAVNNVVFCFLYFKIISHTNITYLNSCTKLWKLPFVKGMERKQLDKTTDPKDQT